MPPWSWPKCLKAAIDEPADPFLHIRFEHDTVAARQRARQIARLLGFDHQDQTRISTAVSEIARNAFNYAGGGRVEYLLEGRTAPQLFIIKITDSGPGIRDLNTILEGRYQSQTGMGLGIIGARRLMDQFQIDSAPGRGTTVWLKKLLPKRARAGRRGGTRPDGLRRSFRKSPQDAFPGIAAPEPGTARSARGDPQRGRRN